MTINTNSGFTAPKNESIPTKTTTPKKPIIIPANERGRSALRSFRKIANTATAKNGTVAISRPARPEDMFFSASVIKNQGPTISISPNITT